MHYIGLARNNFEVEAAISLASSIFRQGEEKSQAHKKKLFLVSQSKKISKKDVVIVSLAGVTLGACFLVDRTFYWGSSSIQGTFLSSICIASFARGEGLSELLIKFSLNECKNRSSAFALVIARKAVDHYYLKFGFYGIASYSQAKLILKNSQSRTYFPLEINCAQELDINVLNKMYEKTYSNFLGACIRSPTIWRNILIKLSIFEKQISIFTSHGKFVGYVIHSDSDIFEIACASKFNYIDLLTAVGDSLQIEELILHVPPSHPALRELLGFDVSISKRSCSYGGHMVKIIDKNQLIISLESEIVSRFRNMGFGPFRLDHEKFNISFNGNAATLSLNNLLSEYEKTCLLMGTELFGVESNTRFLLGLKSFNIPLLDQV